ncbi:MAG: HEAT repeat domain-containing protein [Planctomycetes bacterium]|nr:HEAT repeat domain-containing protein [Planctomycetota bacterium]
MAVRTDLLALSLATPLFLGALAPCASGGGIDAFQRWFEHYQRGRVDLYQQVEAGCLSAPEAAGDSCGVRYFRTEGLVQLEELLAGAVACDPVPDRERRRCVRQQPWLVRRLAAEALARVDGTEAREWLRSAPLRDESARDGLARRAAAARALGAMRDTESLERIAALLQDEEALLRAVAARSLADLGDPAALGPLERALKDPEPGVRLEALLAVDRLAGTEAGAEARGRLLALAVQALADRAWTVRLAACEILHAHPDAATIPELVLALAREAPGQPGSRRRVRSALRSGLAALTGEDFPSFRPEDWARWWEAQPDGFRLSETLQEVAPEQGARFFGIPLEADVVLFLLDISGSMNQPVGGDPDGPTRLFTALRETRRCVDALEKGTRFNILLFNERVLPFRPAPIEKTEESLEAVCSFLEGVQADGGTDLSGALGFGLGLEDPELAARVRGEEIDTIVLLSDGVPSRGAVLIPDEIASQVSEANRGQRIAIHTVAAGGAASAFLARLAGANYGQAQVMRN